MPEHQRIPAWSRQYPDWVTELMSDRQVDALPPPMLWAKVVQRCDELGAAAVTVALGLALDSPVKGSTFAAGMRRLSDELRRSRGFIADGIDQLEAYGFLGIEGGHGHRNRYTLAFPGVRIANHVESEGVRWVNHVESSEAFPRSPAKRNGGTVSAGGTTPSTGGTTVSTGRATSGSQSGHVERRERPRALSSANPSADAGALEGAPRRVRVWSTTGIKKDEALWDDACVLASWFYDEHVELPRDSEDGYQFLHNLQVLCYEHDWNESTWEADQRAQWAVVVACDQTLGSGYVDTLVQLVDNGWELADALTNASAKAKSEIGAASERIEPEADDVVPKSDTGCVDCGSERHRWCGKASA